MRPEGNLPLEAGFHKRRPPEGETGSSCYTLALPDGERLTLWGFGLFYATPRQGGVYLNPYQFQPCWLPGSGFAPKGATSTRGGRFSTSTAPAGGTQAELKRCSHQWRRDFKPEKTNELFRAHAHMKMRKVAYFLNRLDQTTEANGRTILSGDAVLPQVFRVRER